MKKSTRIRPVLESLESMVLLSTAPASLKAVVPVEVRALAQPVVEAAATQSGPVVLRGVLRGTGQVSRTTATINGSGRLGRVGNATFQIRAGLLNPPSSVTLNTSRGKLFLQAASPLIGAGTSGSTTYSIVGGTRFYANATGSGSVAGSFAQLRGNRVAVTIRFT